MTTAGNKPFVIGLTGSMGAGKSTAARILADHMPVLDLDAVNRQLLDPGEPGWQALSRLDWIALCEDGTIDRRRMADRMFSDEAKRQQVEQILHPLLWQAMEAWTAGKDCCAVEVPLLFETGSQDRFDQIWCVTCDQETALSRLQVYRGYSPQEARARLARQLSVAEKAAGSDVVLNNDGDPEALRRQIEERLSQYG